ncbi:MAG: TolC family protein [Methylococcales bacterium]
MLIKRLVCSLLMVFSVVGYAKSFNIGMVLDGPMKRKILPINQIKQEIIAITKGEFDVRFPENKVINGQWQLDKIRSALSKLNQDDSVDLILTNGLLSSHEASKFGSLKKPVIATIVADRVLQELPYVDGVSGKRNFTYITDSHTVEQDIRQYYRLIKFKYLVIPVDHNILKALPLLTEMVTQVQKELGFKLSFIPVYDDLAKVLSEIPQTADAIYIPPLMRFSKSVISEFAAGINHRSLPSFSLLGRADLELGFMATLSGRKVDELRFSRRIALYVQSILLGTDPADLKVDLNQPPKLAINMKTVRAIGLPLNWKVLEEAELLHDERFQGGKKMTLVDAISQAVAANLGLQADKQNIILAEDQVDSVRSALLPQLKVNVSGNQIDSERAGLLQAERTADAELQFSQLIYSERSWSNFDVAKLLKQVEDASFRTRILDVMQSSATAYLQVLLARATEQVREADLKVSEANLELAQSRLKIGFSDRSDSLRWQSEIANDRRNLYLARADREQAETVIKQQLHFPLGESIAVTDDGIGKQINMLNDQKFNRFFDNPLSFDKFTAFEIERAFANAPELRQIESLIESNKRQLIAGKRAYYIPDVSANARFGQNISQGGIGAKNPNFQDDNWSVGFQATLPLFTSGARSAEISRASHSILQNRFQRENIYEQIEARVRSALQKSKGSFPAIRLSKAAAQAAEENFYLVSDSYAQGVVSITDLIDAQNAKLESNLSAIQALYLFMIDWVEIQRAVANFDLLLDDAGMDNWYKEMDVFFKNNS